MFGRTSLVFSLYLMYIAAWKYEISTLKEKFHICTHLCKSLHLLYSEKCVSITHRQCYSQLLILLLNPGIVQVIGVRQLRTDQGVQRPNWCLCNWGYYSRYYYLYHTFWWKFGFFLICLTPSFWRLTFSFNVGVITNVNGEEEKVSISLRNSRLPDVHKHVCLVSAF